MGSSSAPPSRTADMNSAPPTTRASLLASIRRLPARAAARQGGRPAAPTMAAITASTSGCDAISHRASAPTSTAVALPASRNLACSSCACTDSGSTANLGFQARHWASNSSTRWCAVRANTSKRSGCRERTSSVLVPMDPVEPRMHTRMGRLLALISKPPARWRSGTPATRRRPGRARHRGRGASRCCPWHRRFA